MSRQAGAMGKWLRRKGKALWEAGRKEGKARGGAAASFWFIDARIGCLAAFLHIQLQLHANTLLRTKLHAGGFRLGTCQRPPIRNSVAAWSVSVQLSLSRREHTKKHAERKDTRTGQPAYGVLSRESRNNREGQGGAGQSTAKLREDRQGNLGESGMRLVSAPLVPAPARLGPGLARPTRFSAW